MRSHRCRVSLQHQLLSSPHLLLLHLSADGLFGLIGQLTARRQARIPHHLLNTPASAHTHTHTQTVNSGYIQTSCWAMSVFVFKLRVSPDSSEPTQRWTLLDDKQNNKKLPLLVPSFMFSRIKPWICHSKTLILLPLISIPLSTHVHTHMDVSKLSHVLICVVFRSTGHRIRLNGSFWLWAIYCNL